MLRFKAYLVPKILLMISAIFITATPVLAWGEDLSTFPKKNKARQEVTS